MTEEDDIDGLAAEYVLGSLSPAERGEVEARRGSDAALASAIEAWQVRLGPLSEQAPGLEPPSHLFGRILTRLIPTARLQMIDDGHLFMVTQPVETARMIEAFLKER